MRVDLDRTRATRRPGARPTPGGHIAWLALGLWISALAACTYDPHPADGTLACSSPSGSNPSQCPQGYFCDLTLGTCFAGAATGSGSGGSSTGAGGTGGAGGTTAGSGGAPTSGQVSGTASDYLGSWVFGLAAASDNSCSDGTGTTTSLADKPSDRQILVVTAGPVGVAALTADWLCSIHLDVDGGGAHLGTGVNKCTAASQIGGISSSTWTATKYELTVRVNDRTNATLVATYTRVDTYADAHLVTCTQKVRAPLHKQ